jgi:aspartyl-tRNA(Asn)/glutamyl-tRNA(Gln) amidotransferase subunit C
MALTIDEVRRIAALARLRLSPEQEATFTRQLGEIVDYVDQLRELPGGEPAAEGAPASREADDVAGDCLPRELVLANAPASADGFLLVPEVLAEGRHE